MTVRMKNTETGAVYNAPDSAVPMLVQSGWQELSKKECAALDQQAADDLAAAEEAMRAYAATAVAGGPSREQADADEKAMREFATKTLPAPPEVPDESDQSDAGRRDTAEKENG